MVSALRAGTYLVAVLLAVSVLVLLAGLGMAARPEAFAGFGLQDTAKTGMVLALVGGIGAMGAAALSRILMILRGTVADR
jgi:hypothetical protein